MTETRLPFPETGSPQNGQMFQFPSAPSSDPMMQMMVMNPYYQYQMQLTQTQQTFMQHLPVVMAEAVKQGVQEALSTVKAELRSELDLVKARQEALEHQVKADSPQERERALDDIYHYVKERAGIACDAYPELPYGEHCRRIWREIHNRCHVSTYKHLRGDDFAKAKQVAASYTGASPFRQIG